MTTRIGTDVHFDPADVGHKHYPANLKCHAYGVLKIDSGGSTYANLYFGDAAAVRAVIAELALLAAEMDPPVITDSERDCDEVNPDGLWPCYRSGDHGVHIDHNGSEWRSDLASVTS